VQIRHILETSLYVDDLAKAEDFYATQLGLRVESRGPGRHVFFRCGEGMLLLFDPDVSGAVGGKVPAHGARGHGHVAFAIGDDDVDAWREHLGTKGVEIEKEMQWPGGGFSIYVRDPAGNSVELATKSLWHG
jgi:catechol 2,3-dioxygenase-like lactoylglutathione lyase family enzyme